MGHARSNLGPTGPNAEVQCARRSLVNPLRSSLNLANLADLRSKVVMIGIAKRSADLCRDLSQWRRVHGL